MKYKYAYYAKFKCGVALNEIDTDKYGAGSVLSDNYMYVIDVMYLKMSFIISPTVYKSASKFMLAISHVI